MPISIGKAPESDYTNPLGLLSDCHRRIEHFLNLLVTVVSQAGGARLLGEERQALETALRYFHEAAPKHTSDEEQSLFPRLRALQNPQAQAAFSVLDRLEEDHYTADAAHQEIDSLCQKWLSDDSLTPESCKRLGDLLERLKVIYETHIAIEDAQIFPLARTLLKNSDQQAIALEMASRRGIALQERTEMDNVS
jgi:hemerythrin-like domain-containing protein